MSDAWWFTRARLRGDAPVATLRRLLVPDRVEARADASHRLVWSLFGDHPERTRDFLWRESEPGCFYILSQRPPVDPADLFEIAPPKPFAPVFNRGDRLQFALRANATRSTVVSGARGARHDVVMHAIRGVAAGERAGARREAVQREGQAWLTSQGARAGFSIVGEGEAGVRVLSYRVARMARPSGHQASLGILDVEGTLSVDEPDLFTDALVRGFGRGKAFGCGLMLVRRA